MKTTTVSTVGEDFAINGRLTYEGREYRGWRVEGLLMNARLIQGIFDDLNEETRGRWDYPDGPWDAERNTAEFVAMMPEWRASGLLGFTLGLQGGSPMGYSKEQPWHNSAFASDGSLRPDYMKRLKKILDRADELGMVPIVSFFYFGQDERLEDEVSVIRATDEATDWLLEQGYGNVVVEVANETNIPRYEHEILCPGRIAELIVRVQERSTGRVGTPLGRLLAGTSYGGGRIPNDETNTVSDVILIHGNGQHDPARIHEMVRTVRAQSSYRGQPIVFNEDDHFDFEKEENNMVAAVSEHASWGYFDYRMLKEGEGFEQGYQSMPVDWGTHAERKRGFFRLLQEITGA